MQTNKLNTQLNTQLKQIKQRTNTSTHNHNKELTQTNTKQLKKKQLTQAPHIYNTLFLLGKSHNNN